MGSSPRMRGTRLKILTDWTRHGIIPAYAGNTYVERIDVDLVGDHPRVCGEHVLGSEDHVSGTGSSPRMRGTLALRRGLRKLFGIIPAYAGNTFGKDAHFIGNWDHPRVCGEHHTLSAHSVGRRGSSPRMRGTH